VGDVAGLIARAVESPGAREQAYNAAVEEIFSLEDCVQELAYPLDVEDRIMQAPLNAIRKQPGQATLHAPFVGERFLLDISKAKRELGYRSTPLATWHRQTMLWFREMCRGPDSEGYALRERKVRAARTFRTRHSLARGKR